MKKLITKRKVENNKNVQFEIANCFEWCDSDEIKSKIYLSINDLIKSIESGEEYYTKNIDNSDSKVVVEGGNIIEKYVSSISNDGITDNINNLPTY